MIGKISQLSRREFVVKVSTVAASTLPVGAGLSPFSEAAPTPRSAAESIVQTLHDSLTESQKSVVLLPWNDSRRSRISANWKVTEPGIGSDFYTNEQRHLIDQILRSVTSPDGYERLLRQMKEDWGGIARYAMAIFRDPGSDKFLWEMTGRHLTLRADGNSVGDAAFGGPIVYGHGAGDSVAGLPGNVYYYQLEKANQVFQALDGKQRQKALLPKAPPEEEVPIQGRGASFSGIAASELSPDQRTLVEETMQVLLAPFREEDVTETMSLLKAGGGLDQLHLAFYQSANLGDDQEWQIWRLEAPTLVWHFRGSPHVHTYVNIGKKA